MRDFDSIKQKEMGNIENRVRHIYNRGYEDGYKDGRENIIDEPCEDCISRKAVLKKIAKEYEGTDDLDFWNRSRAKRSIEDMPSVQSERKMGRWITGDGGYTYCNSCRCVGNSNYDYCPHCGAKMQEGEE